MEAAPPPPSSITPTGSQPTVRESLGYNAQGLLAGVTTSDGLSVMMGYNARGLRASIAVTDTAPREWTPLGPVGQAAARFTETVQYWGGRVGQVTVADAADPFTETFLYRPDGSPLELLYQRAGQPLAGYWYDGWAGGPLPWYWLAVRYYDPEAMRWLQPDPSEQDGVLPTPTLATIQWM